MKYLLARKELAILLVVLADVDESRILKVGDLNSSGGFSRRELEGVRNLTNLTIRGNRPQRTCSETSCCCWM